MYPIREVTDKLLKGSIVPADDGTRLYTPDGLGSYKALWTRDFAYMVLCAGELIPDRHIRDGIEYLLRDTRAADGWIPDRVYPDRYVRYAAGDEEFPGDANLDNGPYLMMLADAYLHRIDFDAAKEQFLLWQEALTRGLECLPVNEDGLIINESNPPHSPYGFTDCICKTGLLAMETLLYWQALRCLVVWMTLCGQDASDYRKRIDRIEAAFAPAFLDESGMLLAATGDCRQIDVWASSFALHIGFPLTEDQKDGISRWLIGHYDGIVEAGQIRHLPQGEYWQRTFMPVEPETYQNGAFWATPTEWFCSAINRLDHALAKRTVEDALYYFETEGIFECVNGSYRKLDTYVASAVAVYAAVKNILK